MWFSFVSLSIPTCLLCILIFFPSASRVSLAVQSLCLSTPSCLSLPHFIPLLFVSAGFDLFSLEHFG